MKLKEVLAEFDESTSLKIGATESYFYMGTVGEYLKKETEISEELRMCHWRILTACRKRKEDLFKRDTSPTSYARKLREEYTVNAYLDWVGTFLKAVETERRKERKYEENLNSYKPLYERDVIIYRKQDPAVDENCVICIVEGEEKGAWWYLSEGKGVKLKNGGDDDERQGMAE